MKTADLIGPALDWAVAKVQGYAEVKIFGRTQPSDRGWVEVRFNPEPKAMTARFDPSENWEQGGPIIDEMMEGEFFFMENDGNDNCHVAYSTTAHSNFHGYGPTPLIAAMRCVVASRLGDEVDVPEKLL